MAKKRKKNDRDGTVQIIFLQDMEKYSNDQIKRVCLITTLLDRGNLIYTEEPDDS